MPRFIVKVLLGKDGAALRVLDAETGKVSEILSGPRSEVEKFARFLEEYFKDLVKVEYE